jgi:hypothetical protein
MGRAKKDNLFEKQLTRSDRDKNHGETQVDSPPMMECGHLGYAMDGKTQEPICLICELNGIPAARVIATERPVIAGRQAQCSCNKVVPSKYSLPFFEPHANREFDSYYCGCSGWD